MVLIALLTIILLILVSVVLITVAVGGSIFIIVFADVIVCAIFIVWLIKKLSSRR